MYVAYLIVSAAVNLRRSLSSLRSQLRPHRTHFCIAGLSTSVKHNHDIVSWLDLRRWSSTSSFCRYLRKDTL